MWWICLCYSEACGLDGDCECLCTLPDDVSRNPVILYSQSHYTHLWFVLLLRTAISAARIGPPLVCLLNPALESRSFYAELKTQPLFDERQLNSFSLRWPFCHHPIQQDLAFTASALSAAWTLGTSPPTGTPAWFFYFVALAAALPPPLHLYCRFTGYFWITTHFALLQNTL